MLFYFAAGLVIFFKLTNMIAYGWMKESVVRSRAWDLNICCGKTDGGGVNVDIIQHTELPNFQRVEDITALPFDDKEFDHVLCSHTIEHVDNPEMFFRELSRVGGNVTVLVPPLWDLTAAFNIFEHKWLFLTLKHRHATLPPYISLPLASWWQKHHGQRVRA